MPLINHGFKSDQICLQISKLNGNVSDKIGEIGSMSGLFWVNYRPGNLLELVIYRRIITKNIKIGKVTFYF